MLSLIAAIMLHVSTMAAAGEPGGVELSMTDGRIGHVRAFGYADIENSVRMRPEHMMRIASLTKQFTAVAILKLAEQGRLSLDDTLTERLPDCPAGWGYITLRQLLSHTSGLTGDLSVIPDVNRDFTPRELVDIYATTPLAFVPGAKAAYSNLNYWILGLVIEESSGVPFERFVLDEVLAPAGVTSARIGDWSALIPRRARGYETTVDGDLANARRFSSSIGYAAGGFVSSIEDLARWYDALGRGRIISKGLLAEALTPVALNGGELSEFGLGWRIDEINGERVAHHGGSTFGFRGYVYWAPDRPRFVAVLLNSSGEEPRERAAELAGVSP